MDLNSRITVHYPSIVNHPQDVIFFDLAEFNIFYAAGLLLYCFTENLSFLNIEVGNVNEDWKPSNLNFKYVYDFFKTALRIHERDKSKELIYNFRSTNVNITSASLLPVFGYEKPTIECHYTLKNADLNDYFPYEHFILSLTYQMYLNESGFSNIGLFYHPVILKCDPETQTLYPIIEKEMPFSHFKSGCQPLFPSANDLLAIQKYIDSDYNDFLDIIKPMDTYFWIDMICLVEMTRNTNPHKIFNYISDYSLKKYVSKYWVYLGGESFRPLRGSGKTVKKYTKEHKRQYAEKNR